MYQVKGREKKRRKIVCNINTVYHRYIEENLSEEWGSFCSTTPHGAALMAVITPRTPCLQWAARARSCSVLHERCVHGLGIVDLVITVCPAVHFVKNFDVHIFLGTVWMESLKLCLIMASLELYTFMGTSFGEVEVVFESKLQVVFSS